MGVFGKFLGVVALQGGVFGCAPPMAVDSGRPAFLAYLCSSVIEKRDDRVGNLGHGLAGSPRFLVCGDLLVGHGSELFSGTFREGSHLVLGYDYLGELFQRGDGMGERGVIVPGVDDLQEEGGTIAARMETDVQSVGGKRPCDIGGSGTGASGVESFRLGY